MGPRAVVSVALGAEWSVVQRADHWSLSWSVEQSAAELAVQLTVALSSRVARV
jgi:hypothetical protein